MSSADPVDLLRHLVSFRTDVTGDERPLADRLAELLAAHRPDAVTVMDVPRASGKPAAYVYARFGKPKLLVNAHLDTVPPNADWTSDPFTARIDAPRGRFYALGAADTKGAAAAILAALASTRPVDTGILFSGDEEFSSVAMRAFLASEHSAGIERAIVCEPTNLRPGVRHRGFCAFEVGVSGPGGHSSKADEMPSPIGRLAALAVRLDAWGTQHKPLGPPGFLGMCLNLAKLDGGIAFNVIPAEASLVVSLRPPPGADTAAIYAELEALAASTVPEGTFQWTRRNAPFATENLAAFSPHLGAAAQSPIDLAFWTEAALLREKGIDAVVLGPGNIAQAHAPNEWVDIEELGRAADLFRGVFAGASA
jgi:acetylornithine deacetylase